MTRKDFELIAETIRELRASMPGDTHSRVALAFAKSLRRTNPAFNHARFIAACDAEG